ncbi:MULTISPECIES: hypothetical protein [unclassified Dietzia]|nr:MULTISPECIES: hypothetical protein [unclassified Dietzia]
MQQRLVLEQTLTTLIRGFPIRVLRQPFGLLTGRGEQDTIIFELTPGLSL